MSFLCYFFFHFLPRKMQRVLFFTPLDKLPQDKLNPVYSPVVLCNQFFFLNSHFKLEHCNGIENLCSFKSSSSPNCRNKIMVFGSIFWLSLLLHNGLPQNTHVLPRSLPSLNIITFPFITPILVEVK